MRSIILIAAFMFMAPAAYAGSCDVLPPIKPFGCFDGKRICMCSADGENCQWVWVCE